MLEAKLVGERSRGGAAVSALLAAYKPSEFAVTTHAGAESWVHGDEARFEVHGEYLFGAPMSKAGLHWTVTRERFYFYPPWAEGYALDDYGIPERPAGRQPAGERRRQRRRRSRRTRKRGGQDVRWPSPGQRETEQVVFEATVTDVTRHTVAARASRRGASGVALRGPPPAGGRIRHSGSSRVRRDR